MIKPKFASLTFIILIIHSILSATEPYRIYIDADFTHYTASAKSIEAGIKTALNKHQFQWEGAPIELKALDHRGNTRRSQKNLQLVAKDPMALGVFSGLHSPPLLTQRDWINQKNMTVLVPWAAAGPITRPKTIDNHIFRLSVDDHVVGPYLIKKIKTLGLKKPFILLENTGWGKGNFKSMSSALKDQIGVLSAGVGWFEWNLSKTTALLLTQTIEESKADCIIFVGNTNEAVSLFSTFVEHQLNLPIFSHWGITGGDFANTITQKQLEKLDLKVLQTKFSDQKKEEWMALVQKMLDDSKQENLMSHIKLAPTGFFHAHDLTMILMEALQHIETSHTPADRHQKLREQLEHLNHPIKGLIKIYKKPFSTYDGKGGDQHEALSESDLCLGQISRHEGISLLP
jgi:branched-chain amino acid transport system substrate-binding protein